MSARPYRHADGSGRKRYVVRPEALSSQASPRWAANQVGDGHDAEVSRGAFVEWYTPATDSERAQEEASLRAQGERTEAWERETYERLRAKFDGAS